TRAALRIREKLEDFRRKELQRGEGRYFEATDLEFHATSRPYRSDVPRHRLRQRLALSGGVAGGCRAGDRLRLRSERGRSDTICAKSGRQSKELDGHAGLSPGRSVHADLAPGGNRLFMGSTAPYRRRLASRP